MGSTKCPPSFSDGESSEENIFDTFINKDCFLDEVSSYPLNTQETTSGYHILQRPPQQQQPHLPEPSPPATPATPEADGAPSTDAQSHVDIGLNFSESHFLSTEMTNLPLWEDPSDLFNFKLATPHVVPVHSSLDTTGESISHVPVTFMQPPSANATTGNPIQSPRHYYSLPPTPLSLPSSATTSPAPIAPSWSSIAHSTPTPTTIPPLPTTTRTFTKPRPKKAFPCTYTQCDPTTITHNSETPHHHHHKDLKRRFCCRYEDCISCTSYTTRKDCKRHEDSKHSDQHLVCDVCGHTTARSDNMRGHVRTAHPEEWEAVMKRIMEVKMKMVMGFR
ncbi:hypothetical protein L873DRAFT_1038057 [Choiromyces venosus 120613-1]|uniref:C2H2-type domain-containing protein n=1 Tax=Choiromyces venosus 120613-1 TaxID=1336337 RepID=A0A3N4JJA6_9PEZI|nr:hypothetical protein L873DRAFT_1038057 [Choiromyces venosus 120613-1]